jgi:hypothetical protein
MRIRRENLTPEGIHHHAVGALPLDLGQIAEECLQLLVGPVARRLKRAGAEGFPDLAECPVETGDLLAQQAARENQLLHLGPWSVQQLVPCPESLLQGIKPLLIGPFAGLAREDDVDQLVGRVRLVAEIRSAVENREDTRDLAEVADAGIEPLLKLARGKPGCQMEATRVLGQLSGKPFPPADDLGGESTYPVPEIPALAGVGRPARQVWRNRSGVFFGGWNRFEIVGFGTWTSLLHLSAFPCSRGQRGKFEPDMTARRSSSRAENILESRFIKLPAGNLCRPILARSPGHRPGRTDRISSILLCAIKVRVAGGVAPIARWRGIDRVREGRPLSRTSP